MPSNFDQIVLRISNLLKLFKFNLWIFHEIDRGLCWWLLLLSIEASYLPLMLLPFSSFPSLFPTFSFPTLLFFSPDLSGQKSSLLFSFFPCWEISVLASKFFPISRKSGKAFFLFFPRGFTFMPFFPWLVRPFFSSVLPAKKDYKSITLFYPPVSCPTLTSAQRGFSVTNGVH